MSHANQTNFHDSLFVLRGLLGKARGLGKAVRLSTADARQRRTIAALSVRQLSDAGVDRSVICGNMPTIEVEAGLMSYLMSLR